MEYELKYQMIGALVGLLGALTSHGTKEAERDAGELVETSLAMFISVDRMEPLDAGECLTEQIRRIREEKEKIAPSCAVCPAACGNTEDLLADQVMFGDEQVRDAKKMLLDRLGKYALANLQRGAQREIPLELYGTGLTSLKGGLSEREYRRLIRQVRPAITEELVEPLFESRFLNVFDMAYNAGRHYYLATRRPKDNIVCLKEKDDFREMLPDAVTCIVILECEGEPARLLLTREFRYPVGQYLWSPPAGLLDPEDCELDEPILSAAAREIREETGLTVEEGDRLFVVNPLLFSTPGMTDESNALACAVLRGADAAKLSGDLMEATEVITDYRLPDRREAMELLRRGKDEDGVFYSTYTWAALMYFVSELWRE